MAKVLVTGASGLLGANIVYQLNRTGYEVRILVRSNSNLQGLKDCKYEIVTGNINNIDDLKKAIYGCDYVIHSAALTAQISASFEYFWQVNVKATQNLIKLAKEQNIKRFIYISTANCFSPGSLNNPGTEKSEFLPWLKKSNYAYTKFVAQQLVLEEYKTTGFPAIVIAPTFLIGPRDTKPSSGKLLLYALKHNIIFYPNGGKSFADVENVAKTIVKVLKIGKLGEVYLLAGTNMTYRQFFEAVANIQGKKKIYIKIPDVLLTLIGWSFTFLEKLLKRKFVFDIINKRLFTLENFFSSEKAIYELGYELTDINEAIKKSINWFKQNGNT